MNEWRMPEAMRMGPVCLRVRDLDGVATFYRSVVGLVQRAREDRTAILGTEDRPLIRLEHDPACSPRAPEAAGLFHTAVRVPSRSALGAALRRLRDHGALDGASDHGVSEALYLADPEGNGIEIYRDRPQSAWPRRDGGLVIPTDPLDVAAVQSADDGSATVPPGTDIGHVHLEVTDLDRTQRFFTDTLGLNLRYTTRGAAFLAAADYHHHIGINTWQGRSAPRSGCGLGWITLYVPEASLPDLCARIGASRSDGVCRTNDPDDITVRIARSASD